MERHANMAGLVLEQVFATAIVSGIDLSIDLSRTEDAGESLAPAYASPC
jgi:cyanate lyase